jgi:hypothetical protein
MSSSTQVFVWRSRAVVRRRRLVQRYNLCNLGTPTNSNGGTWSSGNKYYTGEHTITANCSILSNIYIRGTLKITGVADSNGVKPAIDGGWDGTHDGNFPSYATPTGVRLFKVQSGTLIIDNMILTHCKGGQHGGGAFKITGGSVTLTSSIISRNIGGTTEGHGGGLAISGGSVILKNTIVSNNWALRMERRGGGDCHRRWLLNLDGQCYFQ